jgi:hypothetical protein
VAGCVGGGWPVSDLHQGMACGGGLRRGRAADGGTLPGPACGGDLHKGEGSQWRAVQG